MTTHESGAMTLLALLLLGSVLAMLSMDGEAQTEPPAGGLGDWSVADRTVIEDRSIVLHGNLIVGEGGELTLLNTTLLLKLSWSGQYAITVERGGTLHVLDGSTLGPWCLGTQWRFMCWEGSTVQIMNSTVEDCGTHFFSSLSPRWERVSLYVATPDAVFDNVTFAGSGLVGLFFQAYVRAPPVRNCSFESGYGVITHMTDVKDCVFTGQRYSGVVAYGLGVARGMVNVTGCRFESCHVSCVNVGYEWWDPWPLGPGSCLIEDCELRRSTKGIWLQSGAMATIGNCTLERIVHFAIMVEDGSSARVFNCRFSNSPSGIRSEPGSSVDWTVTDAAVSLVSNISLTGDLTVEEGAELRLIECGNLTFLCEAGSPSVIRLGRGAHLELVNGSLEIPDEAFGGGGWGPPLLAGEEATLTLAGVRRVSLSFPVELAALRCSNTTLPLGRWKLGSFKFTDCTLVADPGGHPASLVLEAGGEEAPSLFERCLLDKLPSEEPGAPPWLDVRSGRVVSRDFLHDLDELLEGGSARLPPDEGQGELEVHFSVQAHMRWQNNRPVTGFGVAMEDSSGMVRALMPGPDGSTQRILVMTERATGRSACLHFTPLTFSTMASDAPFHEVVEHIVEPMDVYIVVMDVIPPFVVVDQEHFLATNTTELVVTGNVYDPQSGLALLTWAVLPDKFQRMRIRGIHRTFKLPVELRKGLQTVSVRGYDAVGNRNEWLLEVYYSPNPSSIRVLKPEDGALVNTTSILVHGETESYSTVEVMGRVQTTEDGIFRILVPVEEGPNVIVINSTNLAGNRNSTVIKVVRDTVAPSLDVLVPAVSPVHTNRTRVELEATAEEGVSVYVNSVLIGPSPGGSFSATLNLDEGINRVLVRAVDGAGNVAVAEVVFWLDSRPPPLIVELEGEDALVYTDEAALRSTSEAVGITIRTEFDAIVTVNGEEVVTQGGEATIVFPLAEGLNHIIITAVDAAGNAVELPAINIDVDRSPPALRLEASLPITTDRAILDVLGTTEPNATLTLNGIAIVVREDGSFHRTIVLSKAMNRIVLTASDEYGQTTEVVYEVEMVPPVPPPMQLQDSLVSALLGLTALILVVEAVALVLLARRGGGREGSKGART